MDITKIRVLIYRPDIYNLQTKIVSFQGQEKLLQGVVFSLAVSMNANTKNSQVKHCPSPKYVVIKKPNLNIYRPEKKFEKWPRVKTYLLKYAIIKNL